MKFGALLAALGTVGLAGTAAAQWCPTTNTRKSYLDMSDGERQKYFGALRQLNSGTRPNQFDRFAQVHVWFANDVHGGIAVFLAFHRQFVRDWEQTLQRVSGDSSVFQPYWDWSVDSQNPPAAPIFSDGWLGGNSNGGCANIPMLGGQVPVWWDGNYGQSQHCLTRNFDADVMRAFWPQSALQVVFDQSPDYTRFCPSLEIGPHSNVHVAVGGDMNTMASPNDPVFFFHHSYLDKLWHDWQNVDYSNRLWSYGGVNRDGTTASYNDKIPYYGNQVWTVLPLGNMCYDYGSAAPFKRDAGAVSSANGTALASVARVPVSRAEVAHIQAPAGGAINLMPPAHKKVAFSLVRDVRALMTAHANNLVKDSPVEKFVPKIDEPLKHVAPLPDAFIQMNKMDPLLVRRWEFRLNKHINNVNAANGFASSVIALAKP